MTNVICPEPGSQLTVGGCTSPISYQPPPLPPCNHYYKFAGIVYRWRAFSNRNIVDHWDWFYCVKCLDNRYLNKRKSSLVLSGAILGAEELGKSPG